MVIAVVKTAHGDSKMKDTVKYLTIIAGVIAAPFYITLILTLGALEPGFDHQTMPMSILGGVPGWRGVTFNFGVVATGVCVMVFGIGLRAQFPAKISSMLGLALLVMGGIGMVGAGCFHCNEGCRNILIEPDLVGRLHIAMSLLVRDHFHTAERADGNRMP